MADPLAQGDRGSRRTTALIWLVLLAAPLLLYAGTLHYPLCGTDDVEYYQRNPALYQGWRSLIEIWKRPFFSDYAPITQLTILVDLHLQRGDLWVARLQELLWLGLGAIACERMLWRLTGSRWLAAAIALAYVVHPVCAEEAMWLAERKNVVAIACSWFAIERHLAWRQDGSRGAAVASWMWCAAALLSKPHAVVIPAVLAAYEAILGTGVVWARALRVLPTAALTGAFVAVSFLAVRWDVDQPRVGGNLAGTILCDGPILLRYLAHSLLPQHLTLFYRVDEQTRHWPWMLAAWMATAAIVATTIALAPSARRRLALCAWMAALASLLPAINLVAQLLPFSDHYLQWALPWVLLAFALPLLRLDRSPLAPRAEAVPVTAPPKVSAPRGHPLPVVAAGIILFLALLSLTRTPSFRSEIDLYRTAVQQQPDCAINWGMYCLALATQTGDAAGAGRAGLIAWRCTDANRMLQRAAVFSLIYGALVLRSSQGAAASDALVAAKLPGLPPAIHPFVQGVILLQEQRYGEARATLAPLLSPGVVDAMHLLADRCRSTGQQPWELPALGGMRFVEDSNRFQTSMSYVLQELTALAEADLETGRTAEAADLLAVVLNITTDYTPAVLLYLDACQRLHRTEAVGRIERDLLVRVR